MKDFNLDNEPKITTGFTTPDGYFSDFSKKIMSQLPIEKEEIKVISFWTKNRSWIYASAAIIVVALSIPIMNLIQSNSDEVQSAEIENYLSYHSTLTDDEIVEYLDESDLKKIKVESTIEPETIEQILYDEADLENQITN
jgi:hypothetical protein